MPRVPRKKRVLRTVDSTLHALQVLDFIFDDGADPYIDDLSAVSDVFLGCRGVIALTWFR